MSYQKQVTKSYQEKCYQGINPKRASLIIVGKDANWPSKPDPALQQAILTYLKSPESFIRKSGKHHPLVDSNQPGSRYHKKIAHIVPKLAQKLSLCLLEISDHPTFGKSETKKLKPSEVDVENLYNQIATASKNTVVLICPDAYRALKSACKLATDMPGRKSIDHKVLTVKFRFNKIQARVYQIYHPSAGQFNEEYINQLLQKIKSSR